MTPLNPILEPKLAGHRSVPRVRTPATEPTYAEDFARFELWCTAMGARALPADSTVVMYYLGHLAPTWRPAVATDPPEAVTARGEVCESPGLAPGTLVRHLSAIAARHVEAGHRNPTRHPLVVDLYRRIRDRAGDPSTRHRVAPPVPARIQALVADIMSDQPVERDPLAARDVALVLLGSAAALPPRELAALTLDQVREDPAGACLQVLGGARGPVEADLRTHRTHIAEVGGDACPVAAWRRWRGWLPEDTATATVGAGVPAAAAPGRHEGVAAFRSLRKGRLRPDGPGAREAARGRIGGAALTERSVARIVANRARHAGLLGHWAAGTLGCHDLHPGVRVP